MHFEVLTVHFKFWPKSAIELMGQKLGPVPEFPPRGPYPGAVNQGADEERAAAQTRASFENDFVLKMKPKFLPKNSHVRFLEKSGANSL